MIIYVSFRINLLLESDFLSLHFPICCYVKTMFCGESHLKINFIMTIFSPINLTSYTSSDTLNYQVNTWNKAQTIVMCICMYRFWNLMHMYKEILNILYSYIVQKRRFKCGSLRRSTDIKWAKNYYKSLKFPYNHDNIIHSEDSSFVQISLPLLYCEKFVWSKKRLYSKEAL